LQGYPIVITNPPPNIAEEGCYLRLIEKKGHLGVGECVLPAQSSPIVD